MNIHEAMKDIVSLRSDSMDGVAQELEKMFGSLPECLHELLAMKPGHYETDKSDPLIKLNKTGILNFEYNFSYDILGKGMIPIFDAFDGRYIVYRVAESDFCVYCVISEKSSWITKDICELIKRYF